MFKYPWRSPFRACFWRHHIRRLTGKPPIVKLVPPTEEDMEWARRQIKERAAKTEN